MKWYNDMFKMTSRISLLLCGAVAFASAADSTLVEKQKNLVGTLDSLNSSVMGLRLGGTAKAGVLSSKLSSDQLLDQQDFRENQAYTDVPVRAKKPRLRLNFVCTRIGKKLTKNRSTRLLVTGSATMVRSSTSM